ncbi:S8 family serine peptidase [Fulvivirga ligni]|uniref:S8 family serine peptidase n=1 Tax=Fulvivirga ligni TaxID=2904246 RepID=UPI001F17C9A6|nr:S8 family serine peptidase [Fulvivirga ligni]UII23614.1 S8 family serine peptidase [Fulvivirga ligni]
MTGIALGQTRIYQLPQGISSEDYAASTIIVKVKTTSSTTGRVSASASPEIIYRRLNGSIKQVQPAIPTINTSTSARTSSSHRLSNIFKVEVSENKDVIEAINELLQSDQVVYAEPYFNLRPLNVPSDPEANTDDGKQSYLSVIKAYEAWNIETGDTTIVIGILDTGVDLDHPDLKNNLKYNYNDPVNGIDDDNDGLVDNFQGWDIANNDNRPEADTDQHGTKVSGTAAASTNNGTGIAGTGFKSKFLPIKIFKSGTSAFNNGYEAIALAADLGCQVINLSWGGAGAYSAYGQDIINYAVLEKDVAIIAAAGNTHGDLDFYPASFENVLSVGATDNNDKKASFGTYSDKIDLVAPGVAIFTTFNNGQYDYTQGTSFSSPAVAGTVALLRARYPELNAHQIMEKVRVTTDDIYSKNPAYQGMLGKGRLNMFRALTDNTSPSIRISDIDYNNGSGQFLYHGDSLSISMDFTNYLIKSAASTEATISSTSPYVTVLNNTFNIGELGTLKSINNASTPFQILISEELPPDTDISFRVDFVGGAYQDFQIFTLKSSPDYLTVRNDSLALTVVSNGKLGYKLDGYNRGIGLLYKNNKVLDNIGFAIAANGLVHDNFPINLNTHQRDDDFNTVDYLKLYRNSEAEIDVRNTFSNQSATLRVEQKTLSNKNESYLILEYRITNTGTEDLTNVSAGLFTDWNLNNKNFNAAYWNDELNMGYTVDNLSDTLVAAVALLDGNNPVYSALDNRNFNGNSGDILSLITDENKLNFLTNGIYLTEAGAANTGNDVSQINGASFNLKVNESAKIVLAISVASSFENIVQNINKAKANYNHYKYNPPVLYTGLTCQGSSMVLDPPIGDIFTFYSDSLLQDSLTTGSFINTGIINEPQTYYAVNKDKAYNDDVVRVIAAPKLLKADFSINPNPLLLDETGNTRATISDLSKDAVKWEWDLGNGIYSNNKDPLVHYTEPGTYHVTLTATNDLNCVETTSKDITVYYRSNLPDIDNQKLCSQADVELKASNASLLNFYSDANLNEKVYSGNSLFIPSLAQDTTLYITSIDSAYESNPKKVVIEVSKVKADFSYGLDTLDLNQKQLLNLKNSSENNSNCSWYVNGVFQGSNEDITYDFTNQSNFGIVLVAEDENGCFDRYEQFISPFQEVRPNDLTIKTCTSETVSITPENNEIYYFYQDANAETLLHKGSNWNVSNINSDSVFYFTSMNRLIESEIAEINIETYKTQALFTITENSLSPIIENSSIEASQFIWMLDADTVSYEKTPILELEENDQYHLTLVAINEAGCSSLFTSELSARSQIVSGIDHLEDELKFFPNPATDYIQFNNKVDVEIYSAAGQILLRKSVDDQILSIKNLSSGIYWLKVTSGVNSQVFKLLKQ